MKTPHVVSTALLAGSLFFLGVSFTFTGCTSVQISDDASGHYRLGELESFADRDFASTHAAVIMAFKGQGFLQTKDEVEATEAEVTGRDATDTYIEVKIKAVSPTRTSVKIRYSHTGDLAQSQKLYHAIESHF
jgi:hypothetical protein